MEVPKRILELCDELEETPVFGQRDWQKASEIISWYVDFLEEEPATPSYVTPLDELDRIISENP